MSRIRCDLGWRVSPLAIALVVAGCAAVGPNHRPPVVPLPAQFVNPPPAPLSVAEAGLPFWRRFGDPLLAGLVERALVVNHDVRIAMATLQEVRAVRSELRGGLGPRVDAGASARRERASEIQAPGVADRTASRFDGGFDAGWEIDLFGGRRRAVEAAAAQADAVEADLAALRLSLAAEVARTYVELRGLQARLQVARSNLANQRETLRIVGVRQSAGRGTDFDVARSQGLVEATRAAIPALEAALARQSYQLAVLTGQAPGALASLLDGPAAVPGAPPVDGVADPAALLRRRPDVRAAERRLAAATAAIGATTAELFPSVSFSGQVGWNAGRADGLGRGAALSYGLGPSLRWNLFDSGRVRARIAQADARAQGALAAYEKVVLQALQDTDGALATLAHSREQLLAWGASANAARRAARLARLRFDAGAIDLLALLDAERQVLAAEEQLSLVETASATAAVALFKAFGGGWTEGVDLASR